MKQSKQRRRVRKGGRESSRVRVGRIGRGLELAGPHDCTRKPPRRGDRPPLPPTRFSAVVYSGDRLTASPKWIRDG